MRTPYIYIAMFLLAISLTISGAYAVVVGTTAAGSGSDPISSSTAFKVGDDTQVQDLSILSFNDGVGLDRQTAILDNVTSYSDTYEATTLDNSMIAGVTVNVKDADLILYTRKKTAVNLKTTKVSSSYTLDITNAASIYAAAYGNNTKGDYAEQRLSIDSLSRNANLVGYSGSATADKTSAIATQKFISAMTDGKININGTSYVMPVGYTTPTYIAQADIVLLGSGVGNPNAEVSTFTSTSTTKSENSATYTASATTLKGLNYTLNGASSNLEGDGTQVSDIINGSISDSESIDRAVIGTLGISLNAIAASASERRSYASVSAGLVNISEFAMNAQSDSIGHNFDANSHWSSGVHYPVSIEKFCSQTSDGFKAQKSGVSGSLSIVGASGASYLGLLSQASHLYSDSTADYSIGQVSGTSTSLDKPKSGQAYKLALVAGAKATSLTYGTIRVKGPKYTVFTEAYSSALDDDVIQIASTTKKTIGKVYSATAGTKSSGKAGDIKGASASSNIKFLSSF